MVLTKSPVSGSKDAVGSSSKSTVGLLINAFAKLTLFFCPEESYPVILSNSLFNLNLLDK